MAEKPTIPVFRGANVWRLLRTDRDSASATEIPQMAAAACRTFLQSDLAGGMGAKHELIPTGDNEWRFGAARPLKVLAVSERPMEPSSDGPKARLVADRQQLSVPASVRAQVPWYVFVQFFWRLPDAQLIYPAMHEGLFGRRFQLTDTDWLLDKAWRVKVPKSQDPGDETWGEAMGDRAQGAIDSAADTLGRVVAGVPPLLLLGLVWYLSRK